MLRAHLGAEELAETEPGCPEDGGAGPQPETVAGRSPEDGGAEAMLVSGAQAWGCRPGGEGPWGAGLGMKVHPGGAGLGVQSWGCRAGDSRLRGSAALGVKVQWVQAWVSQLLVLTHSCQSLPDCVLGTQLWNAPAPCPPFVTRRFCVGKVTGVWRTGNHAQASGASSAHPSAQKLCGISLHELGVFRIIPTGEEKKNMNLIHYGNAMTFPLFLEENERII